MPDLQLCDAANLASLAWPSTPDGDYARRYLTPLLTEGSLPYVANVHTDLRLLRVEDRLLPLTLNRYHPENSYVCSPYNHYFAYGQEEFDKLGRPILVRLLRLLFNPINNYFRRCNFDHVVYVNNWLVSTNLYPALTSSQIEAASAFLRDCFPDRPIIFCSVDAWGNPLLVQTLLNLGYRMLFRRKVYYQHPTEPELWQRKQIKVDLSKVRRSPYELVDHEQLTDDDAVRLAELYRLLYLDKYSTFNPQFTVRFIRLMLRERLLNFKAFRSEAGLAAALGYFVRNGVMTQPFFGYDTRLPAEAGLYRLLSMEVLLEGRRRGLRVNASAGVGHFKRLRGGRPVLEYHAVYDRHLPPAQRRPWTLLKLLLDKIAVPIINKYDF
ncbi:MAG TPA: GNAT family N-acetyltransferase [Anaerolineae bacterium]|nr:GNAT family N-acetyltransferase [Anaerolineae bacterium]HMR68264.1 GNAT family N-acetyltransferase [Anaerolineae bacterium]